MPVITVSGAVSNNAGTNQTTLTVASPVIGYARVLILMNNNTSTISTVSGGGVGTWTRLNGGTANSANSEIWLGVITSGSGTTVTVSWSGSVAGVATDFLSHMFKSSCTAPIWFADTSAFTNVSSGTSVAFPTLAPRTVGPELYYAAAFVANTGSAGTFSGGVTGTTGFSNPWAYHTAITGSVSPTATQTPGGFSNKVGAVVGVMDGGSQFFGG